MSALAFVSMGTAWKHCSLHSEVSTVRKAVVRWQWWRRYLVVVSWCASQRAALFVATMVSFHHVPSWLYFRCSPVVSLADSQRVSGSQPQLQQHLYLARVLRRRPLLHHPWPKTTLTTREACVLRYYSARVRRVSLSTSFHLLTWSLRKAMKVVEKKRKTG